MRVGCNVNIKEMKSSQWKPIVNELEKKIKECDFRVGRIIRASETVIMLEGGKLPATFDLSTKVFKVWGRGSRYSGASVTIAELQKIEDACKEWFEKHMEELEKEDR